MFKYTTRYPGNSIKEDLTKKMVFIAGPGQCGKTMLAKEILEEEMGERAEEFYLSRDTAEDTAYNFRSTLFYFDNHRT